MRLYNSVEKSLDLKKEAVIKKMLQNLGNNNLYEGFVTLRNHSLDYKIKSDEEKVIILNVINRLKNSRSLNLLCCLKNLISHKEYECHIDIKKCDIIKNLSLKSYYGKLSKCLELLRINAQKQKVEEKTLQHTITNLVKKLPIKLFTKMGYAFNSLKQNTGSYDKIEDQKLNVIKRMVRLTFTGKLVFCWFNLLRNKDEKVKNDLKRIYVIKRICKDSPNFKSIEAFYQLKTNYRQEKSNDSKKTTLVKLLLRNTSTNKIQNCFNKLLLNSFNKKTSHKV